VLVGLCVLIGGFDLLRPSKAEHWIDDGHHIVEQVRSTELPPAQTEVWYVGEPYRPDSWIAYYTGLPATPVTSADQLASLTATHPDQVVVVLGSCANTAEGEAFCRSVDGDSGEPRVTTLAQLTEAELAD